MPRRPCLWTRKMDLALVDFVKRRHFMWQNVGNTNHNIQLKYKAYAEFAAKLGRGFSARSVRDRWVNIRCTFNYNLRKVEKSKNESKHTAEVYIPCWPLWKPLQFLSEAITKSDLNDPPSPKPEHKTSEYLSDIKEEIDDEDNSFNLHIYQKVNSNSNINNIKNDKCLNLLDDLIKSMRPLQNEAKLENSYWFFGKHVTERLNSMSYTNAESAISGIFNFLDGSPPRSHVQR